MIYKADDLFAKVLSKNGFVETFNDGKEREFKRSIRSLRSICFRDIRDGGVPEIMIFTSRHSTRFRPVQTLDIEGLKSIMLFLKLSSKDYKEFNFKGELTLDAFNKVHQMKRELEDLKSIGCNVRRQNKLIRLIDLAENILILPN